MHKITSVIPTYNNLPFLKLTVQSIRQNCYYNDMPIFIFAENCTDGTNEWLAKSADKLKLQYYIETDNVEQRGIGGGIDLCVSQVKKEFVNILHSDFTDSCCIISLQYKRGPLCLEVCMLEGINSSRQSINRKMLICSFRYQSTVDTAL